MGYLSLLAPHFERDFQIYLGIAMGIRIEDRTQPERFARLLYCPISGHRARDCDLTPGRQIEVVVAKDDIRARQRYLHNRISWSISWGRIFFGSSIYTVPLSPSFLSGSLICPCGRIRRGPRDAPFSFPFRTPPMWVSSCDRRLHSGSPASSC